MPKAPKVKDAEREALFKEYDTIRQEILLSMSNRTQVISFGLGTIGVLTAGLLSAEKPSPAVLTGVFSFTLPIVSVLIYYAWFAEFERMIRAGRHLQRLERTINATFEADAPVLTWELQVEGQRLNYPYVVVAMLFLGAGLFTPLLAVWHATASPQSPAERLPFIQVVLQRLGSGGVGEFAALFGIPLFFVGFAVVHTAWRFKFKFPEPLSSEDADPPVATVCRSPQIGRAAAPHVPSRRR